MKNRHKINKFLFIILSLSTLFLVIPQNSQSKSYNNFLSNKKLNKNYSNKCCCCNSNYSQKKFSHINCPHCTCKAKQHNSKTPKKTDYKFFNVQNLRNINLITTIYKKISYLSIDIAYQQKNLIAIRDNNTKIYIKYKSNTFISPIILLI